MHLPQYHQYGGACGLTSLLMALNPVQRNIAPFLDQVVDHFPEAIHPDPDHGKTWQQALEFLLLQIPRRPTFQRLLKKTYGKHFTDEMLPLIHYNLSAHQNPQDPLTYTTVRRRVDVWKHDFELEMLAGLFGCTFQPYPITHDGTGAVDFTEGDVARKTSFLQDRVAARDPILRGSGGHWTAVEDIPSADTVCYKDPASWSDTTHRSPLPYQRYYAFTCSPEQWAKNKQVLEHALGLNKKN